MRCGLIQTRCIVSVVGRVAVFHVTWHVPLDRRSVVQRLVLGWRLPVRVPALSSPTSASRPRYVPASRDRVAHHALENSSSTHWRAVPRRRLRSRLAHRALPRYVSRQMTCTEPLAMHVTTHISHFRLERCWALNPTNGLRPTLLYTTQLAPANNYCFYSLI